MSFVRLLGGSSRHRTSGDDDIDFETGQLRCKNRVSVVVAE